MDPATHGAGTHGSFVGDGNIGFDRTTQFLQHAFQAQRHSSSSYWQDEIQSDELDGRRVDMGLPP
jgi:hypothetical protein